MKEWEKFAVVIVVALALAVVFLLITLDRRRRDRRLAHPIKDSCLRPAGEGLRQRIAEKDLDIDSAFFAFIFAFFLCGVTGTFVPEVLTMPGIFFLSLFFGCAGGAIVVAFKLRSLTHERWKLRLGFEGERYVGQKLTDELMPQGFRVYHDLVFERNGKKFNIDHVVVGRTGIFAIETKTWRKPVDPKTREVASQVALEGETLKVPWPLSETEGEKALDQAARNAATLHDALFGKGDNVNQVIPVLALPGWKVDLQKYGEVAVINARNCFNYFSKSGRNNFSDEILKLVTSRMETLAAMDADE